MRYYSHQALAACVGLIASTPARAQRCTEPHYRWSEKIESFLANSLAHKVSLWTILHSWSPLALFQGDKCAPRQGRELKVYSVIGWVRHLDKTEDDSDWHIELTSRRDAPPDSCAIVEIPLVDNEAHEENHAEPGTTTRT